MNEPPFPAIITLTASADIEPTDDGFAITTPSGLRVELTDLLAERFTINVLGGQRRANRASA